ncbi:diguanylate cyclase domain-containing protein [Deinococcus roseus]|uniref:GGDEF domain-containing protein n=1 Tax=Deinococcus roseus TaxID=392414 RepID=A0ABQ2CW14_9DEIO|nr:diguanylate cyclase [Deinococcus roseus]GGJ26371.1 hypothetical protein GCM10008938_10670 [Deinococcus roseus]
MMDDPEQMKPAEPHAAELIALIRDPASGAYSRELFAPRLIEETARATRELSALTLGLLEASDQGQLSAEQVRTVLDLLKQTLRASDVIFRFSDTEFLLMLPATIKLDGEMTCQRLIQTLRQDLPDTIRLNMGLVTYPEDVLQPEMLLEVLTARKQTALKSGPNTCISDSGF